MVSKITILTLGSLLFIGCSSGSNNSSNGANSSYTTSTNGMKLISNDITPGGNIDVDLTGDGTGESPHLKWSSIPPNTVGYAGIIDDPDAGNYVHWNFFIEDPNITELKRDVSGTANLPVNVYEGGGGNHKYNPPFPPGEKHKYRFCIYGVSTTTNTGISLDSEYDNDTFPKDFESIITGSACFMAFYSNK